MADVKDWIFVALFGVIVVYAAVRGVWEWRAHCRRRQRLEARSALQPADWFEQYTSFPVTARPALTEVMLGLGESISVEWTRLRPNDTFAVSLRINNGRDDEWLEMFETRLEDWLNRHNIPVDFECPDRLGDLLALLENQLARQKPGT